jgi:hypothetical protein
MLATRPLVVKESQNGPTIGMMYAVSKQQPKKSSLKASMAMTYEHYFSDISCEVIKMQEDHDALVTYQTIRVNQ